MNEQTKRDAPWWRHEASGTVVQAWTKSEARAMLKKEFNNLPRLPVGQKLTKVKGV